MIARGTTVLVEEVGVLELGEENCSESEVAVIALLCGSGKGFSAFSFSECLVSLAEVVPALLSLRLDGNGRR